MTRGLYATKKIKSLAVTGKSCGDGQRILQTRREEFGIYPAPGPERVYLTFMKRIPFSAKKTGLFFA